MLTNFDSKNLKTMQEVESRIKKEFDESLAAWKEHCENQRQSSVKRASTIRQAVQLLHAADVEVPLDYLSDRSLHINLGFFGRNKAEVVRLGKALNGIRTALGVKFNPASLSNSIDDADKRTVKTTIRPDAFDGVSVTYTKKLARKAKCKIVRRVVTSLECSV